MISAIKNPETNLPPGFRFHPTDEELVLHYLEKKVSSSQVPVPIIADVDIYKFDPWDLPAKAVFGEKEWYFFSPRDRKYPNGARPNRAAATGYWKATGTDKIISAKIGGRLRENIGVKKALVFYQGRPPKGVKTNWIMHEYRLSETLISNKHIPKDTVAVTGFRSKKSSMRLDDWVLCRIYNKTYASASSPDTNRHSNDQELETERCITQENPSQNLTYNRPEDFSNSFLEPQKSCSFSNLLDAADFSMLNSFLSDNPYDQSGIFEFPSTINNSSNSAKTVFDNLGNFSDGFLEQKLPQLSSLSSPERSERENVKRQRQDFDDLTVNPSRKIFSYDHEMAQKLNLSPYFQFQE